MSQDYAHALGARLRAIRAQQGLSLHGVEEKSEGRSLDGYLLMCMLASLAFLVVGKSARR